MSTRIIKCPNCGVFNTNKEYCENCGELISHQKKREIKAEAVKQAQIKEAIHDIEKSKCILQSSWLGFIFCNNCS